ncbi:MAG: Aminomethyltransferase [Chroococcopsis gigantea SAG 12.99]|nr:Aminomethyltransferase [Chroococcopsis gigantea SAG 12.99]
MLQVYDRSGWGLLELAGNDRSRFLHNQTTNNINGLQPGQGCDTVFVTSTARTIDLATVYATPDSLLIVVSPQRREYLMQWMDKYIFPMDKVSLRDISGDYSIVTIIGEDARGLLISIGLPVDNLEEVYGNNALIEGVYVAFGTELGLPGYTLLIPAAKKQEVWEKLKTGGIHIIDDHTWETLRIQQGRPAPDQELGENYNALEAGLWNCISFDKGCYIGQETIARLNTYKGVKQQLQGVRLSGYVQPPAQVLQDGAKIGVLTSCVETGEGAIGLAYIRTKSLSENLTVNVGEQEGVLTPVTFGAYTPPEKA